MATVCQILINFSQDPKVVLGLRRALEMLREEHNKYYEDMEARKEAEEEKERKIKREEYEKAMKDKGKGKVGEGSTTKEKSPSPQPPSPKPMSPRQPPPDSSQPSGLISSAKVQTRILSWIDLIKEELGVWLSPEANAAFEEARVRDQL